MDKETLKQLVQKDYHDNLLSLSEVCAKYGIKSKSYVRDYLLEGDVRTPSESNKLAHKKFPSHFKHTDETKQKMRIKRLKWIKEHPEKTAWRQSNISYPEKCFYKLLNISGLSDRFLIVREYSIYPYFIDFAFVDEKIAVEIDGSQHLLFDRAESDKKKDELLLSLGWRIIRFTAEYVMHNGNETIISIENMLSDSNKTYERVGILRYSGKNYVKKERDENGRTKAQTELSIKNRKVKNRPSKEELWNMVKSEPFTQIAKQFNVCDNTVKKWCKFYGLPYRKKDIKRECSPSV